MHLADHRSPFGTHPLILQTCCRKCCKKTQLISCYAATKAMQIIIYLSKIRTFIIMRNVCHLYLLLIPLFVSFFIAPSALLWADWKILSFISLLLPATGAGWRIHARRTMQLRRFETKEAIWRQHLASLNKETASTKQRSGQLQEVPLAVTHGRLKHTLVFVLDFIYMQSSQIETDKGNQEPQHVWGVITAADNRSSEQGSFPFCELVLVSMCARLSAAHTPKNPQLPPYSQLPWTQKHRT